MLRQKASGRAQREEIARSHFPDARATARRVYRRVLPVKHPEAKRRQVQMRSTIEMNVA